MTNYIKNYKFKPNIYQAKTIETSKNIHERDKSSGIGYPLARDNNGKNILGIGIPTIVISFACVFFSKNLQKNIIKYVNKYKDYLECQFELNSLNPNNRQSKFYKNIIRKIDSFLTKSESINNITSLKDILFMKLMYATKPTKKVHKAITNWFDNISKKAVAKSYKKTQKSFDDIEKKFTDLDNFILKISNDEIFEFKNKTYTTKELIAIAKDIREEVYLAINTVISPKAQETRQKHIKQANSQLYKTFLDELLKGNKLWTTFVAESQMKECKTDIAKAISVVRNMISYNEKDKCFSINSVLKDFRKEISVFDDETYNQIKKLEWLTQTPEDFNEYKRLFLKELEKIKQPSNIPNISSENLQKLQQCKESYVSLLKGLVKDDTTGEVQDIVSIYRKIAPFEFVKSGAMQSLQDATKSFYESVNLEVSEYFDKVRDLVLGSAPTDILTILLSTGLITNDLSKAKNKEGKKSIILTSGIPLAGAIGTTIIATTKLVSGGKSLALGFGSGLILNFFGKKLDKYMKNKHKQ